MSAEEEFDRARRAAFDRMAAWIAEQRDRHGTALILDIAELDAKSAQDAAERESWALLLRGVTHLKEGAPGQKAGSLAGALKRASLRSSALAATLGVAPPEFAPIYFSIAATSGEDYAAQSGAKFVAGAEHDSLRSRQVLEKAVAADTAPAALKRQAVFSLNLLTECYAHTCAALKAELRLWLS